MDRVTGVSLNPLPKDKILDLSKFKALAEDNFNVAKMVQFYYDREENIVGKGKKCWSPTFSPLTTMFSEVLFFLEDFGTSMRCSS